MLNANVARPYAQALFNLAKQAQNENKWLEILKNLEQIISNKDLSLMLNNPNVEPEKVIQLIGILLKNDCSDEIANLLEILSENHRLVIIPEIYSIFKMLVLEDQKRVDAVLESAYDLTRAEQEEFEKILSNKFGKKISVQVKVNPELIAGVKITINDKVIDSSIKGRLANLTTQLTK